ncbi:MAG: HAMP domain-containing protein [Deltaproteobacteria bacterium]|nr:MAG: HAMP domain-containing protein [Deltaproteobacteria bacterium]
MTHEKRLPLQLKLTATLVLIVMTPLAASAYLIDQLGKAAANVAAGEASSRIATMEKAIDTYRDMVDITKRLHDEIATRLAQRPDFLQLDPTVNLARIINDEPGLRAIALLRPDGSAAAEAERPSPGPQWRDKIVDHPLGTGGATLKLTFTVSATVNEDLGRLKQSIDAARTFSQIRTALPESYRTAFLVLLGVAGLAAAGFGMWASSFLTRRIDALVSTARKVSDGHLDARVELRGQDELAELGSAFNTMLDDLDQTRTQLEYLQRMGVWQDVARRLAHEIKNPLTPIQLAVQQCVSSYRGDEARFRKLLVDTGEIVEEEIAGLRRLVDTFRTLGALPKVEAAPIALAEVIDELKLDPTVAVHLTLAPPASPVTVRADKLLLKRVLANLIENAIHAGEEAGATGDVVVGWAADPARNVVTITVDDHGHGVPEASRDKIFEPYVTTKSTGTGLGLAIARKIAIEHGGDLVLAPDRAPTGGARFVVSLPLRGPDASLP